MVVPGERSSRAEPSGESLENLLGCIRGGDERALEALYDATSRRVFGLALRILSDRGAAEETTLDVYTQVWHAAQGYREERGSVLAWMLAMTRYRAIDRLRASQAREPVAAGAAPGDLVDATPRPDAAAGAGERQRRVHAALGRIPAEQRQALTAAFFGGQSHAQIAAALHLPLGTVKRRIRNGLAKLRDLLETQREGSA
jgi:RNA polymerase sigma-70 factor (ECF subfamily)